MFSEHCNAPRKRPRTDASNPSTQASHLIQVEKSDTFSALETDSHGEESTEFKLAILASLHPECDQVRLLEALLTASGSIDIASETLSSTALVAASLSISKEPIEKYESPAKIPKQPMVSTVGIQSSLASFYTNSTSRRSSSDAPVSDAGIKKPKLLTRKGRTLHLYAPADVEAHTPCSIIHNFLPAHEADALLRELLAEAPTYERATFKLFEREVRSPHTMCFYVDSLDEAERQKTDYSYAGEYLKDVRKMLPLMASLKSRIRGTVNAEIDRRIRNVFPDGKKLMYQSHEPWEPNAAFVNCYDGGAESVGYHSDQLTYLGPRPVIGSLSLGVSREFRVRQTVPPDGGDATTRADVQGQISIHLPHNSFLIMHADMQESWKHSVAPAAPPSAALVPHPVADLKRINITYRFYRPAFHPRFTPRCKCSLPTVLRCVQRQQATRGKYMWMCHAGYAVEKEGCSFFQWAEFDENGDPPWAEEAKRHVASAASVLTPASASPSTP